MFKVSTARILLVSILIFSLCYRLLLMHWATYPPGADIGLHNSVMHSIVGSGNVNFFWNNYQMGGGPSVTFPGYHIFVTYIILLTGIPDFVAHSVVVSLFSTLIVAIAFLVTRKFWGQSTAFIVAFFVAVSRFDIEMLLWGGYPNAITLALIPITFFLLLERDRFSLFTYLLATSLLIGAIFLTHSLSAVVFVCLAFAFALLKLIIHKKIGLSLNQLGAFVVPVFLGAVIVSPFLVQAVPAFLGDNSTMTGEVSDIREALLSTRVLPAEIVVPLFGCVILFFLFSKEYKGKFLTVPSLLLTLWILVPMVFTQGYLVGLYTDYNRFLYFVLFPLMILIGMVVDHGSRLLAEVVHTYISTLREKPQIWKELQDLEMRLRPSLTRRNLYSGFLLALLLSLFLGVTIFMAPWEGVRVQGFYQVMTDPGYDAIRWAQTNTQDSNFTSDALYGWWLGGFSQRPTVSAVDPQYLTNSREFAPAEAARNLLDTDYVIDNGLIQVREDGGYINRHNPMFLAMLNWSYFPYDFFNFNNDDTSVSLVENNNVKTYALSQLSVSEMRVETASDNTWASIYIGRRHALFNYTQIITIHKDIKFANMSVILESDVEGISSYEVRLILQTKGDPIDKGSTIGFFDKGAKVLGQLIFTEVQPRFYKSGPELLYTFSGASNAGFEIWAGSFPVSDDQTIYQDPEKEASFLDSVMSTNLATYKQPVYVPDDWPHDLTINVFDYKKALRNISYIACRDSAVLPKFTGDPAFSRVFINDEVSIFKVKSSLS